MQRIRPAVFAALALAFHALVFVPLARAQPSPHETPDAWLLAFLDVETTGLQAGYHEIVDFGVVFTDLKGRELDRLHVRVRPEYPERTSPEAAAINGYSPARWEALGALTRAAAADTIAAFYARVADDRRVLQVAHNTAFDFVFLDAFFRSTGRSHDALHYYYKLDLPSMAWSLGLRHLHGDALAAHFGIAPTSSDPEEHTGLGCADFALRLYRELLAYRDR